MRYDKARKIIQIVRSSTFNDFDWNSLNQRANYLQVIPLNPSLNVQIPQIAGLSDRTTSLIPANCCCPFWMNINELRDLIEKSNNTFGFSNALVILYQEY